MKSTLFTISALTNFMLLMAGANAAAPSSELTVNGQLVVPNCVVAATDDGIYDLGKIAAITIKPNAETVLSPIIKNWTITCDADTYLTLTPTDNRAASSTHTASNRYGLGNVNGSGKIGTYYVEMLNGTVDGVSSNLYTTASTTITPQANAYIQKGYKNGWAAGTNRQKSGKIFGADFKVVATLASSATMNGPITEDANIDGSMTLNFAFGI